MSIIQSILYYNLFINILLHGVLDHIFESRLREPSNDLEECNSLNLIFIIYITDK